MRGVALMGDSSNKKKKFPLILILKNLWRREGEKAKERKGANTKVKKPPGLRARKVGRTAFWLLFGFMFLVVVTNVFAKAENKVQEKTVTTTKNEAASQEAVAYAQRFAKEYFTWTTGDNNDWITERQNRLKPYLAPGLNVDAGLVTSGQEWSSNPENIQLAKVEEKGENKALITLNVQATFSKKTKSEEIIKKDGKEEKKQVEKEEKKPFDKYFVVPVTFEKNTFGIYELPKFSHLDKQTKVQMQQENGLTEYRGNQNAVLNFVETFFISYSEDNQAKLSYMAANNSRIEGLEGAMEFVSVKNTSIKEDSKKNIVVFAEIQLKDKDTNTTFITHYSLKIAKQKNRFLIKEVNPQ